jgi:hypothetical protein
VTYRVGGGVEFWAARLYVPIPRSAVSFSTSTCCGAADDDAGTEGDVDSEDEEVAFELVLLGWFDQHTKNHKEKPVIFSVTKKTC